MLGSTVYAIDVALADVDRGVYADLSLKVAQHPSENEAYLITRVLAYALEYQEGIAFSAGLSAAGEPAVWVHDLTGALTAWIEIGAPAVERLHKASKACDRVVVYCHKDAGAYLRTLVGQRVYAPDRVSIVEIERALIDALVSRLQRRTAIALSVSEGQLYVDVGGESYSAPIVRHSFPG